MENIKEYSQKILKQSTKTAEDFTGVPFTIENLIKENHLSTDKKYNCLMRFKNKDVELLLQVSADKDNLEKYRQLTFKKMSIKETEKRKERFESILPFLLVEFSNHYSKISYDFEPMDIGKEETWYIFMEYKEKIEKEMLFFNLSNKEHDIQLEVRFMFYPLKVNS